MASSKPGDSSRAKPWWSRNVSTWFEKPRGTAATAGTGHRQNAAPPLYPVMYGRSTTVGGVASRGISQGSSTTAAQPPSRLSPAPPLSGSTADGVFASTGDWHRGLTAIRRPFQQTPIASRAPSMYPGGMPTAGFLSTAPSIASLEARPVPPLATSTPQPRAASGAHLLPTVDVSALVLDISESGAEAMTASEGMANNANTARAPVMPSRIRPQEGASVRLPTKPVEHEAKQTLASNSAPRRTLASPTPTPTFLVEPAMQPVATPQVGPTYSTPPATSPGTPSSSGEGTSRTVQPRTLISPALTPTFPVEQAMQPVATPQVCPPSLTPAPLVAHCRSCTLLVPPTDAARGGGVGSITHASTAGAEEQSAIGIEVSEAEAEEHEALAGSPAPLPLVVTIDGDEPEAGHDILEGGTTENSPTRLSPRTSMDAETKAEEHELPSGSPTPLLHAESTDGDRQEAGPFNLVPPTDAARGGGVESITHTSTAGAEEQSAIGIEVSEAEEHEALAGSPAPLPLAVMIDGDEPEAGHDILEGGTTESSPTRLSPRTSMDAETTKAEEEHEPTSGSPTPLLHVETTDGDDRQEAGRGLLEEKREEAEVEEEDPAALCLGEMLRLRRGNRLPLSPSSSSSSGDSDDETGPVTFAQEPGGTLAARFVGDCSTLQALDKWRITRQLAQEIEEHFKKRTSTLPLNEGSDEELASFNRAHKVVEDMLEGYSDEETSPLSFNRVRKVMEDMWEDYAEGSVEDPTSLRRQSSMLRMLWANSDEETLAQVAPTAEAAAQTSAEQTPEPQVVLSLRGAAEMEASLAAAQLPPEQPMASTGVARPAQPALAPSAPQAPQQTTQAAAQAPVTSAAQVPQAMVAPEPARAPVKLCRQEMRLARKKAGKEAARNNRANAAQAQPQSDQARQQDLTTAHVPAQPPQANREAARDIAAMLVRASREPDARAGVPEAVRHLHCPLSAALMVDPIVSEDGETYQRSAFKHHIAKCRTDGGEYTSPLNKRVVLLSLVIVPNHKMRALVKEHQDRLRFMCYEGPAAAHQRRKGRRRR